MQANTPPGVFVFFGIVGSGKGTQIELLAKVLKDRDGRECIHTSTGNEFRKLIASGNYTGMLIKDSMTRGELQPDFLTNTIFANILISSLTKEKHLIADGYPRTVAQAETFEAMMKFYSRSDVKIIYIEVGKEEAMERNLKRARHDDTPEGLRKRFDEYVENVIPAMNYFKNKKGYRIYTVNGEQSVENVHRDIIKVLG